MNIKAMLFDSSPLEGISEFVVSALEEEDASVELIIGASEGSEESEVLIEDSKIQDGILVDNIDNFKNNFLDFSNPDALYFVVAMKRFKDGNTDVRNRYVEYTDKWFINSNAKWDQCVPEFKKVSKRDNARIYAYPNARSAAQISLFGGMLKKRGERNPFSKAAGRSYDLPERPITHLDVDSTDPVIVERVRKVLKEANIVPVLEYTSTSGGVHFILPDKRVFDIDWSTKDVGTKKDVSTGRYDPYSVAAPEMDKPMLLYYDGVNSTANYTQYAQKRQKRGIDVQ